MPYKSDAQRRFFHTDTAKKAGITDKEVNEFDKASKGMKLPEKKMSEGGDTTPSPNPSIKNEDYGKLVALKNFLMNARNGTLGAGSKELNAADNIDPVIKGSTDTAKGYADGGDITPSDEAAQLLSGQGNGLSFMQGAAAKAAAPADFNNMQQLGMVPPSLQMPPTPQTQPQPININASVPPPTAPLNPVVQASQTAQTMPPTNPSIYQGITAEDRANLMQKLIAQKSSPGMLAASGAAGLGDAITSAFGKAPTYAQRNLRAAQEQNMEQRTGAMDTQRQQKMQDLQANIMEQENDPNSAYSNGARTFASSMTGKKFPSGVTAAQIKSLFPDIVKIMDSQLTAATAKYKTTEEAQQAGANQGFWHNLGQKISAKMGGTGAQFEQALGQTAGVKPIAGASSSGWGNVRRSQ